MLTTNPWNVEIKLLTDDEIKYLIKMDNHDECNISKTTVSKTTMHVLSITIELNPEDEIEYTITPVSMKQLDEIGAYNTTDEDIEKYEEVIR